MLHIEFTGHRSIGSREEAASLSAPFLLQYPLLTIVITIMSLFWCKLGRRCNTLTLYVAICWHKMASFANTLLTLKCN